VYQNTNVVGTLQAKILEFVDACIAVARRELKAPVVGESL